jgi:protein-S-isoprenylcysteine O-methyltransferase Ste14
MDSGYFRFDWLGYFILATYILQFLQVWLYPVPSAGSTFEMLFRRSASDEDSRRHLLYLETPWTGEKLILVTATLAVILVSIMPLTVYLLPPVYDYLGPFFKSPPKILKAISALFLVIGNVISGWAAITLNSEVAFYEFGETRKLFCGGIFGIVRNPITVGLAFIYGAFFLALPSIVMILGFGISLLNSNRRVKMEEGYLERSFGDQYLTYKKSVGKYWPKFKQR